MARKLRLCWLLPVVLACFFPCAADAGAVLDTSPRHFEVPYAGGRAALGPDWLFSAGDDPAYASATYDDSGWREGSVAASVQSSGSLRNIWYRIHVTVRPGARYLAVEMQFIEGGCEIYVNGVRIGTVGNMQSIYQEQGYLTYYDLPEGMISPHGDLVLAFRFALNKTSANGLGATVPFGEGSILLASQDAARRDASDEAAHQTVIPLMLGGLGLVAGLVALALFLAMRNRHEYLAIAVSLLANSFQLGEIVWYRLNGMTIQTNFWETFWLGIANVALVEFVRLIVQLRWSRWLMGLELAVFLGFFGPNLAKLGLLSAPVTTAVYFLPALTVQAVMPWLLIRGLTRGNRDAGMILPPIAVVSAINYWNALSIVGPVWHFPFRVPALPVVHIGTYEMDLWNVWNAVYFVTMMLFLVLRTIGIARERARVAAEMEAARSVQNVLIPEDTPAVPGFALGSVYKPAGEVGGDFFQIAPMRDGGVLVVIGDVSGKGMPAAMTVSLLVGTFRTLVHYTQRPAEILAAMNTRMLARSHGGFTTCLVLRAERNGKVTLANAGHIAPYVAGQELAVENGLPLGVSAGSTYAETAFELAPGQQITLVTDGVVEARDKSGALFGFERTARISLQPAEVIAETAQAFGQTDDITALTLMATAGA